MSILFQPFLQLLLSQQLGDEDKGSALLLKEIASSCMKDSCAFVQEEQFLVIWKELILQNKQLSSFNTISMIQLFRLIVRRARMKHEFEIMTFFYPKWTHVTAWHQT